MINRWNDANEQAYASQHGISHPQLSQNILSQAYATTLLGADSDLTMHGGGNTSIKVTITNDNGNDNGRAVRALYVKATGTPLSAFLPEHFVAMDLEYLESIKASGAPSDEAMARDFRDHQLIHSESGGKLPSIETLMHAFIPAKVVDHTHPAAILKIVNRVGGAELLKECFGSDLAVVPYARMGYDLAMAVSKAAQENSGCKGVVMSHHGLIVWGDDAREVYDLTITIVNKAEIFLSSMASLPIVPSVDIVSDGLSIKNYDIIAPIVKECLSQALSELLRDDFGNGAAASHGVSDAGNDVDNISVTLLDTPDVLELIASPDGVGIICEPPMTPDYPMYFRILPLWLNVSIATAEQKMSSYIQSAIDKYVSDYKDNLKKHGVSNAPAFSLLPRAIVHPQVGVICMGQTPAAARMTADFTRQAFAIRRAIAESGGVYESLAEEYIFDMQYRGYQRGKR